MESTYSYPSNIINIGNMKITPKGVGGLASSPCFTYLISDTEYLHLIFFKKWTIKYKKLLILYKKK